MSSRTRTRVTLVALRLLAPSTGLSTGLLLRWAGPPDSASAGRAGIEPRRAVVRGNRLLPERSAAEPVART